MFQLYSTSVFAPVSTLFQLVPSPVSTVVSTCFSFHFFRLSPRFFPAFSPLFSALFSTFLGFVPAFLRFGFRFSFRSAECYPTFLTFVQLAQYEPEMSRVIRLPTEPSDCISSWDPMNHRRVLEGRRNVWATTWQSPLETPGQRVPLHFSHPNRAFGKVVSTDNEAEKGKT